jgi:hypothetical protein
MTSLLSWPQSAVLLWHLFVHILLGGRFRLHVEDGPRIAVEMVL